MRNCFHIIGAFEGQWLSLVAQTFQSAVSRLILMRHQIGDNLRQDKVGQASCLPFVTPDFDPGSSLDARVRGHDDM